MKKLKSLFNWIGSLFVTGALVSSLFVILGIFFYKAYDLTPGTPATKVEFLNITITLSLIFTCICLIGWLSRKPRFREFIDPIMGFIPIASWFWQFIPKSDELAGDYKEVEYELMPGVLETGIVVKFVPRRGEMWFRVYTATCPVPFTGSFRTVAPSKVQYTGKTLKDYFVKVISCGTSNEENEENEKQKPAS